MKNILLIVCYLCLLNVHSYAQFVSDLLGSGNIEIPADNATTLAQKVQIFQATKVNHARLGIYPFSYYNDNTGMSILTQSDNVIPYLLQNDIIPCLTFEYYSSFTTPLGDSLKWYRIGRDFANRYKPNSAFLQGLGIINKGVTLYQAINEPDQSNTIAKAAYKEVMAGLEKGVHDVDPNLKVVPGGFARPNSLADFTCNGYVPAIAYLLNSGRLDGLDIHTYYGFYATLFGNYRTAQSSFDRVKQTCNITADIDFYCTEFNYSVGIAEGGATPAPVSEDLAAKRLLTAVWDNMGATGQNGRSAAKLSLIYTLLRSTENVTNFLDSNYYLCETLSPLVFKRRQAVLKMVAELTAGTNFIVNDPRRTINNTGTGKFILEGSTKKIWVWQNVNNNWTDATGSSIVLQNVPTSCASIQVYGWDGMRSAQVTNGQSVVSINGLNIGETYMFVGIKNTTLPLQLWHWSGEVKTQLNRLFWQIATGQEVDRFELESSVDGIHFERIGLLQKQTNQQLSYVFDDLYPSTKTYYRLKIISQNGSSILSNILILHRKNLQEWSVYPNPSRGIVKIDCAAQENRLVKIWDMQGKLLIQEQIPTDRQLDLSKLTKGVYLLSLGDQVKKIVLF